MFPNEANRVGHIRILHGKHIGTLSLHDPKRRQQHHAILRAKRFAADHSIQQMRRGVTHSREIAHDAGKRRPSRFAEKLVIVCTDNGDLLGNGDAGLQACRSQIIRTTVVKRHNSYRARNVLQPLNQPRMVRMGNQFLLAWVRNGTFDAGEPLLFYCLPEAVKSLDRGEKFRKDSVIRKILEAAVDQVLGRLHSGGYVVKRDHAGNRRITRARASNDVFTVLYPVIEKIDGNAGKNQPIELRPAPAAFEGSAEIFENDPVPLEIGVACDALENRAAVAALGINKNTDARAGPKGKLPGIVSQNSGIITRSTGTQPAPARVLWRGCVRFQRPTRCRNQETGWELVEELAEGIGGSPIASEPRL